MREESNGPFRPQQHPVATTRRQHLTAVPADTKVLVRVTGPCVGPVEDTLITRQWPALRRELDAPDPCGLVAESIQHCGDGDEETQVHPAFGGCQAGRPTATFGAADGDSYPVEQTRLGDGRFPPVAVIIPKPSSGKARVWVDPLYLADVLKTIAAIACDEDNRRVEIEVNGEKPIAIRAQRSDGLRGDGVLMPLPGEKDEKRDEVEEEADAPEDATQIEPLREIRKEMAEQLEKTNQRIADLERDNERVRNMLLAREDKIADLLEDSNGLREKLQTAR